MTRILRGTLATFGLAFATAATAQTGYYVAVPVAQPTAPSLVTHLTTWRMSGTAYVAERSADRHQLLCRQLAGQVGPLGSFTVRGAAYDADALAQCNAHAKPESR
ncbi:hypothetical protein FSB78_14740 [Sphingomonas ginsenosidivorax]|uniref:UrcA family protein n=1 Tax=Sphingomonas ginsenosidivorax TaxID=862135 RepID=A0A5C6UI41_9SPHN|nr:hypothetical protein [Sphingomonas ginsenosidivorax]TXC72064.1 hypothetical protein FSB78_14740 [Sphingomonas ginsenosidivorax]